ncbi:MAG: MotA/TolQ/ExbB proton channel family protein [Kiritimatiellae bacterium]|nr:MotA/TolQ/ExbB proton channel family protein [Kiritimatiellia bacterium]
MFEGKSVLQIFVMGGFTMYVLLGCSILSVGVILERLFNYYRKSRAGRIAFMQQIKAAVAENRIDVALAVCDASLSPVAMVVREGLKQHGSQATEITSAMEREIMVETTKLEQYTSIVGTIGNIAVYIGLFGTVLGIIRSFHDISRLGSGGISIVIGGVSEALICTAAGLMVAVPAVVAYNYFIRRVDAFVVDMEYCASATLDLLQPSRKG